MFPGLMLYYVDMQYQFSEAKAKPAAPTFFQSEPKGYVPKISAQYLFWLFHVYHKLGTLHITIYTSFFKGLIRIKYLSLHVPFPVFNTAVSQPVPAVLLSPQKIDIFSRYTFEGSKFKNKRINFKKK